MRKLQHTMQVVTVLYIVAAGLLLWLISKKLSANWLLHHLLSVALGLIVIWFVLVFLVLKIQSGKKQ